MAPEEWIAPEMGGGTPAAYGYAAPLPAPAYELRPLSLGEILDRTFAVYRSRFWLFVGIGALEAAFASLMNGLQLAQQSKVFGSIARTTPPGTRGVAGAVPNPFAGMEGMFGLLFLVAIVYLGVYVVTQAVTVFAMSEVYLGQPVTVVESVKATIGKWYRYLGIAIWQAFSMFWLPMLLTIPGFVLLAVGVPGLSVLGGFLAFLGILGGIPVGFILYLRNSLAVQATVVEGLPVRASMRRSKVLSAGTKGRIFVVLLLAGALAYIAGLVSMPLMMMAMFKSMQGTESKLLEAASMIVHFAATALVTPVAMIGISLVYFDQRVRKEALDLVMMMGREVPVFEPVMPAAPVVEVADAASVAEPESPVIGEDVGPGHDAPLV
jgi:hypothetical protein